jgi:hypothetical protein
VNQASSDLPILLCVLVVAIPIGLLIGAAILRAACSLYNKIAGATSTGRSIKSYPSPDESPGRFPGHEGIQDQPSEGFGDFREDDRDYGSRLIVGVPEPEIPKAMGIVLVAGLANAVAKFCIGVAVVGGAAGGMGREGRAGAELLTDLISIPINFLIGSAILAAMLPTSFGKACLVTLIQFLIVLAIVVVVGGIVLAIMVATGARMF